MAQNVSASFNGFVLKAEMFGRLQPIRAPLLPYMYCFETCTVWYAIAVASKRYMFAAFYAHFITHGSVHQLCSPCFHLSRYFLDDLMVEIALDLLLKDLLTLALAFSFSCLLFCELFRLWLL
ncbi:hypothetical protein BDF20DRAFT_832621 [Mycotypha africana]|uniref:uncharacterized protein n=1 Tax=Mycotypha africana TaxID=64632 RepID=UPI002300CF80|nr:uncharacterized protein BDF20DRAFT_832621 [Mycotypha africana]KAI8987714.1 hypothetical protein BDF20DRAFT_832621 [Mycotypha africana]